MAGTKLYETDVIVVGGGIAGCMAALTAGKNNKKVILIDRYAYPGGTGSASIMGQMTGSGMDGKLMFGGYTGDFINELIQNGDAKDFPFRKTTMEGTIGILRYNVESFKSLLEDWLLAAGVKIFYNSVVTAAVENKTSCTVNFKGFYDEYEVRGRLIIDATGNASVASMLGHETLATTLTEKKQAVAVIFKVGNVDKDKYLAFEDGRTAGEMKELDELYEKKLLPARFLSVGISPNTNEAYINATFMSNVDYESTEETSKALIELRRQAKKLIPVFRKYIPGLENCFLSETAPSLGVRSARRIAGKYVLKGMDIAEMKFFEDAIAPSTWPVDIHDYSGEMQWVETPKPYMVPYRALVPAKGGRLIAAGKCISADDDAFAAIRIMPTAAGVGEAAGQAAAIALEQNIAFDEVNGKELHDILKNRGVQI